MAPRDFYAMLNVTKDASKDDIKKAFKKLALECHPDKNRGQNEQEANKRFHEIREAYETLSDDVKRIEYDVERSLQTSRKNQTRNYSQSSAYENLTRARDKLESLKKAQLFIMKEMNLLFNFDSTFDCGVNKAELKSRNWSERYLKTAFPHYGKSRIDESKNKKCNSYNYRVDDLSNDSISSSTSDSERTEDDDDDKRFMDDYFEKICRARNYEKSPKYDYGKYQIKRNLILTDIRPSRFKLTTNKFCYTGTSNTKFGLNQIYPEENRSYSFGTNKSYLTPSSRLFYDFTKKPSQN